MNSFNKRLLVLSLGLVFALSFVWSLYVVSAIPIGGDSTSDSTSGVFDVYKDGKLNPDNFFGKRLQIWLNGPSNANPEDLGAIAEFTKYLVLILVALAVFGALSAMSFPSSAGLRMVLSIIVGLLGTFMVTTQELLTILISYSALTLTVVIAVPLIAILGFTVMAAYRANAAGLYASKILWACFALFIIFKAVVLIMMHQYYAVEVQADGSYLAIAKVTKVPEWATVFLPVKNAVGASRAVKEVRGDDPSTPDLIESDYILVEGQEAVKYSSETDDEKIGRIMGNSDISTAWVLLLVGFFVMWFMVIRSKWIYAWLEKEARDSAIEAAKNNITLSTARDKLQADAMRKEAKT